MLLYHIFTGFSWVSTFHSQSKTFRPRVHRFLFHCPSSSPYISPFFYLCLHVLFHRAHPSYVLYPEAFRCRRSFCLLKPSSSSWSQTKHRKKMCLSVLLVVCMHMHGRSSASVPPLSPFPPPSDVSERSVMSSIFSSCLFSCTPCPPSVVLLPMMLLRNYRGGWGRRETVLSSSLLLFLNYPFTVLFSFIHPLLLLILIPHPRLPLDPGVRWGWIVAGLIVELAVGPRGWVEVYIVAGGFEALQVHVEITLRGAPSRVNLVLIEGLVLVVDAVRRGRVLERRVGLWRQALRRDL